MQAKDIMTTAVVSVGPEASTRDIARLLVDKAISAVPVVDAGGAALGMVSEGDLIGRDETARVARRDWWLSLLAEGEELNEEFLAQFDRPGRTARDIMTAPIVTADETADIREIARLLATYRIKRVPVVHEGKVVGIVSRADLVRALAGESAAPPASPKAAYGLGAIAAIEARFLHGRESATAEGHAVPEPASIRAGLSVTDFRGLVQGSKRARTEKRAAEHQAAEEARRKEVKALIDHHIADQNWQSILHNAREAAEHGEKEYLLLRFPHELCSDGGRAINLPEAGWPTTLRGEAAEIYLRWERDLRSSGFHLAARVLDFPGGFPGDIGLFLIWGE